MKAAKTFPDVSVVVPAHNEERFLPQCLESLRNQDYQGSYEVIVWQDNPCNAEALSK